MIAALLAAASADDQLDVDRLGEDLVVAATWSGHPEVWWVTPEGPHLTTAWPARSATNPALACGRAACLLTVTLPAPVPAGTPATAGWLLGARGDTRGPLFFGPGTRATPTATRRGFLVLVEEPEPADPALRTARLHAVAPDGAVAVAERLDVTGALGGTIRLDADAGGVTWTARKGDGRALRFGAAPTDSEPRPVSLPRLGGDPPRFVTDGDAEPLLSEVVVREGAAVAWIGRGSEPGPGGATGPGVVHVGELDGDGVVAWSTPVAALGRARAEWVARGLLDRALSPDRDGRGPPLTVPVVTDVVLGHGQAELALDGPLSGDAVTAAPPDDALRSWAESGALPEDPGLYLHLREDARGPEVRTTARGAAVFAGAAFTPQDGPCGPIRRVLVPFDGPPSVEFERGEATFAMRSPLASEGTPGRDGERRWEGAWEGDCAPAAPAGGPPGGPASFWLRWQTEPEPAWSSRAELGPGVGFGR